MMLVSLYTSRVVLSVLGVEDFGIYNVVGGVVSILAFLKGTLSTASSRFIVVALGERDLPRMKNVFSNVLFINMLLAAIIVILAETVGLWFLYEKMTIPSNRMTAAFWVYQISVATTVLNLISVPYNASIIAHERMKAFAYITLFDAFAKLALILALPHFGVDYLIAYALIIFFIYVVDQLIYLQYCTRHFEESHVVYAWDKKLFKDIMGFITWASYGSFATMGFTQGLNVLLNLFFGPTVNAARGIAVQVEHNLLSFTSNFQVAIGPQLMMSTSQKRFEDAQKLFLASTRYCFYLLCILGLPVIAETPFIMNLWLGQVPDYAVSFCRIILVTSIWGTLANPLRTVNQAEGNIKKFQLYECTLLLTIVPVSYLALKLWHIPILVFVVNLVIDLMAQFIRLAIVLPKIGLTMGDYFKQIYARIIPIFLLPCLIILISNNCLGRGWGRFFISCTAIEIVLFALIYAIGISREERDFALQWLRRKLKIVRA